MSRSKEVSSKDIWKLIDLYYSQPGVLYAHQHDSFNQFIEKYIPDILTRNENVFYEKITREKIIRYKFKFENIQLEPPMMDHDHEYMFPADARKRSLTYSAKLISDVTQIQEVEDLETGEKTERQIGDTDRRYPVTKLPVMVRSKYCSLNIFKNRNVDPESGMHSECRYDPGGYFIVNGNEKAVVSQESRISNKPMVFVKKDTGIYTVQVDSKAPNRPMTQNLTLRMKKDGIITLSTSQLNDVPVYVLLRALGMDSDQDIVSYIVCDESDTELYNMVNLSMNQSMAGLGIYDQNSAISHMATKLKFSREYANVEPDEREKQRNRHLNKIMRQDILPHLGGDYRIKALYICYMVNKLLSCRRGRVEPDDRDSYVNKRVKTPGILLAMLFGQYFKAVINSCNKFFRNHNNDDENPLKIINQIKPSEIEQGIKKALSTGSWGGSRWKGVAQVLPRQTYFQSISFLRKVVSPTADASTVKLTSPRHIHNTQYGLICPVESPEGGKVGLNKNLAMMSTITLEHEEQVEIIEELLNNLTDDDGQHLLLELLDMQPMQIKSMTKVFLNGNWLGMTNDPHQIVEKLRQHRMNNIIHKMVSIVFDTWSKEIHIHSDGGRLVRPLLRVDNMELVLKQEHLKKISLTKTRRKGLITKWNDFLIKYPNVVEFVDVDETMTRMIAMYPSNLIEAQDIVNIPASTKDRGAIQKINRYDGSVYRKYTHCEFHPSLMLGTIASSIPFCNSNQGPRNIYQFSQAKQAMGIYTSNFRKRMDISYVLHNPQTPLVTTRAMRYLHTDKLPAGENVVVAIACYTGYNQEDSVLLCQEAIDRGLFRSVSYKKFSETISNNQSANQNDIFKKPERSQVKGMKNGSYEKLVEKGYVPKETKVVNNDILIGKISPIPATGNMTKNYKDNSVPYKANVSGVVDEVYHDITNNEGYPMIKMRVRSERKPKIGDKFSSRHGQKGTVGLVIKKEDMPFTVQDGITPDIIINPNCIPSRMTMGQLIECVLGKISAIEGHDSDGTPFNEDVDITRLGDILEGLNYQRDGRETMRNGMTGETMDAQIFIGPTYYQRLKHMVDDKIHSRSRGPLQLLTRQPPEGRSRDGGLRFGEMERDVQLGHGNVQFLKERLVDTSDAYSTYVCDKCGLIAAKLKNQDVHICRSCGNNTEVSKINIPYAFKLLIQELMSMSVAPRIRVKKNIYSELI